MANVAVRGQPVEDPWLTWSTPEYGEGFWPVNNQEVDTMELARQSIPCHSREPLPGCYSESTPGHAYDGVDPGVRALIHAESPNFFDPGVQSLIEAETDDVEHATLALIAQETRPPVTQTRPTPGNRRRAVASTAPGMDTPTFYGAASSWGGEAPSFTSTLVGWGLLVRDPVHDRVLPTVRTGRLLFEMGVIAGLIWGYSGRSW
jgi:hypothetical protein